MNHWYYADAGGHRHGPVTADELRALAMRGTVGPQTLVWREGEAQWRPLHDFATTLGLPPPMPATPAAPQPAPRGLSGCAIAALVGVAGVVLLGVLGILAAIALPAYNDYVLRSQAMAAIAEAGVHKAAVVEFMAANERCPSNDDEGFESAGSYAGAHLASIQFGQFEESTLCGMSAEISAPGKDELDGQPVWLEYNPAVDTWLCSSAVEDRYLPHDCRG